MKEKLKMAALIFVVTVVCHLFVITGGYEAVFGPNSGLPVPAARE